jgi:hypothetical protein
MSDLKTRARVFLDFAIDSVVEGFSDPECYSEADHAITCLDRIFEKERPVRMFSESSSS